MTYSRRYLVEIQEEEVDYIGESAKCTNTEGSLLIAIGAVR